MAIFIFYQLEFIDVLLNQFFIYTQPFETIHLLG